MKIKRLTLLISAHAGVSLAAFFVLNAWAVGALDGGNADAGALASGAGLMVNFALLQPLAYWVLAAFAWWTWPGLMAAAAVVLLNSLVQVGGLALLWRSLAPRPSGRSGEG